MTGDFLSIKKKSIAIRTNRPDPSVLSSVSPGLVFPPCQLTADPSTILCSAIPAEHPKDFPVLRFHSAAARTGH